MNKQRLALGMLPVIATAIVGTVWTLMRTPQRRQVTVPPPPPPPKPTLHLSQQAG